MLKRNLVIVILVCLSFCALLTAKDKDKASKENGKGKKDELTLEKLFPEKSFFGPSARSMEFSFDGKYAAYLYRPYKERRHGSDLWIYDVVKGQARRVTSVSVMARFQESTREVKEDRIKKAKEADKKDEPQKTDKKKARDKKARDKKKKNQTDKPDQEAAEKKKDRRRARRSGKKVSDKQADEKKSKEQEKEEKKQKRLGDWLIDKDADDEKAPRYSGIESFTWSPKANELLFVSKGDIYRCRVTRSRLTRLMRTRENERRVAWLPDASGYTYMRGDDLMMVRFRSDLAEQLYVKLPDKERMTQYKISPDGKRMVFLSQKEGPDPGGREKKVNIAQYRDRFMKVKEVSRGVSDDPIKKKEVAVYTLEINELMKENSVLTEVYRHTLSQPRDYVKLPEWSPDSARAVFAVYDQVTEHVNIVETTCPEESDKEESKETEDKDKKRSKKKDAEDEQEKDTTDKDEKEDEGTKKNPAKVLHRFLHTGGPTTPRMIRPYYLADNRRIIYMSEKTGFRQLHVLDPLYESDVHLTQGHFEVYPLDITKDHKWMFVTATKEHPARLDVYKVSLEDGEMSRLSQENGYYGDAAVSPDGTKVLANFAHYGAPRELVFVDTESRDQKQLTDSHPPAAHETPSFDLYLRWPVGHTQKCRRGLLSIVGVFLCLLHGEEAWLCHLHYRSARQLRLRGIV